MNARSCWEVKGEEAKVMKTMQARSERKKIL